MAEVEIVMTGDPYVQFGVVARAACLDIAQEVADLARELAPVSRRPGEPSGLLKAGFRALPAGDGAVVVNPVRYWRYVEFGTSSHDAQPHLSPAVEIVRARHT